MAKIDYFTSPKLADGCEETFIGIKLTDIELKNKYAQMSIDTGFDKLLSTICSVRSGLVYTPYGKNRMIEEGEREWTYLIGIKPTYEFQEVNEKGNIRALYGGDGAIETARFNERPHFDSKDDARMFIATRIAKFSTESVYDIANKIGCYGLVKSSLMAMPEIYRAVTRELQEASSNEPTGLRLKALLHGVMNYMSIKYTNNKTRQVFELLVVGFTDEELQFYGYSDEDIAAGHKYDPHNKE